MINQHPIKNSIKKWHLQTKRAQHIGYFLPKDAKINGNKWVVRVKLNDDRSERYKSRVAIKWL